MTSTNTSIRTQQKFGSMAAHVASGLGALRGYGHGETAAAYSLQYVQDELMKIYNALREGNHD